MFLIGKRFIKSLIHVLVHVPTKPRLGRDLDVNPTTAIAVNLNAYEAEVRFRLGSTLEYSFYSLCQSVPREKIMTRVMINGKITRRGRLLQPTTVRLYGFTL